MTRKIDDEAKEKFKNGFTAIDWEQELGEIDCPSTMTGVLHERIDHLNDECFPWVERKKKSTDPPWITDDVRTLVARRKRKFKKDKTRSAAWKELKDRTKELIRSNKIKYLEKEVEKLIENGQNVVPYRALKDVAIPERPPLVN